MHNSESGAHRSPVAMAQKVTGVIKQTVENQHELALETLNENLSDEATHFFKIAEGKYLKVQAEQPIICILVQYIISSAVPRRSVGSEEL